jgi:nicotinamide mononucleotide adenylyltransferase
LAHIDKNKEHYDNLLKMHGHLANAKNELVNSLESNEGGYEHSIGGVASKPEGFVYNHTHNGVTEPTKLVNRAEFARQNLLKSRGAQEGNTNASDNHHTIAFGRMNPPTAGHEKLVQHMQNTAKKFGGGHTLVLSGSQDTTAAEKKKAKNPLSPEQKLMHAQNAFPGTNIKVADKQSPTILQQAADLHKQGVTHLHFAGGEDRKPMAELLKKYNGVKGAHGEYNFKDITFENAGKRDENAKGVEGVSGTKLRGLASAGKKEEFHSHLSSQMKPEHKDALYNDLRKAMQ